MPGKFNPLDPIGLFQETDGTLVGRVDTAHYEAHRRREVSIEQGMRALWPPPDPLGVFSQEQGSTARHVLPAPPDPLGVFQRHSAPGAGRAGSGAGRAGSGATIGNPIPIEWADQVVPLKNQAREILIGKGYPPAQVDMALHWAEEWLMGMARRLAPGNMELQKTVVVSGYADIASRAEKWLQGIEAVFGTPAGVR